MYSIPAKITVVTPAFSTAQAWRLGVKDAKDGDLCVPEMYFVRRDQQRAYAHGYEFVAGVTLGSSWFTGHKVTA